MKSTNFNRLNAANLLLLASFFSHPAFAAEDATDARVIQEVSHVSTGNQVQQFSANLAVPDADRTKRLTLTVVNGPGESPKFAWVRVFLGDRSAGTAGGASKPAQSGRMIINEASFKGANKVDLNLTGIIKNSSTLTISGAGYKGATLNWKITTPSTGGTAAPAATTAVAPAAAAVPAKAGAPAAPAAPAANPAATGPQIASVNPKVARGSGAIDITGSGFSASASEDLVLFNQTRVSVTKASATSVQVNVPSSLSPGQYNLQVISKGLKTPPFPITVAGTPELAGNLDISAGQCGTKITIFGKNFAETASDNIVYFQSPASKTKATAEGVTKNSLSVTVPQFPELDGFPSYAMATPIDITVVVGTTLASGHATFTSSGTKIQESQ